MRGMDGTDDRQTGEIESQRFCKASKGHLDNVKSVSTVNAHVCSYVSLEAQPSSFRVLWQSNEIFKIWYRPDLRSI